MLIGQLAEASGIAATTLRFYEADSLLESERDCHGYRRYDASLLQRLTRIRAVRTAGWSVAEIGQLGHLLETAAHRGGVWPGDVAAFCNNLMITRSCCGECDAHSSRIESARRLPQRRVELGRISTPTSTDSEIHVGRETRISMVC